MPIRTFQTISIEFGGGGPVSSGPPPDRFPIPRAIRLVESRTEQLYTFILYDDNLPEYTLAEDETEHLLHLLGQIAVIAPWQPCVGFDGTDCELTIKSMMSSMTFCWWMETPAGWETVGAVFDYVMAVVDRRRAVVT